MIMSSVRAWKKIAFVVEGTHRPCSSSRPSRIPSVAGRRGSDNRSGDHRKPADLARRQWATALSMMAGAIAGNRLAGWPGLAWSSSWK